MTVYIIVNPQIMNLTVRVFFLKKTHKLDLREGRDLRDGKVINLIDAIKNTKSNASVLTVEGIVKCHITCINIDRRENWETLTAEKCETLKVERIVKHWH